MGEGTSPLLNRINLSLSQDLGRSKAIMAIYMESEHLRIVPQSLWQHSSHRTQLSKLTGIPVYPQLFL